MASQRISDLTSYTSVISTDVLPIVDITNGATKKIAISDLTNALGWQFLGQGTASAAVRTSTVTWTGAYKQLMVEYFIAGYSGSTIGRVVVGPSSGITENNTLTCTSLIEGVTITTTSTSTAGFPTAVTTTAATRYGVMFIDNQQAVVKRMVGHGMYAGTAPSVVPTQIQMAGMFNDTTNLINKIEMACYDTITTTTVSANTFNAGTYFNVYGRNN